MPVITQPERTGEFLQAVGDAPAIIEELRQARKSAQVFSSDHPRLIDTHAGRWVALHDGHILADAASLDELLATIDVLDPGIRASVLVRFIERRPQTMIL